jgi:hypothetical protein
MASPKLTDERLTRWLDANQLDRERLCQAILSIDKRFSAVKPRQPRGGPDGGRDLEALYNGNRLTYGAVGFQNSVSDSEPERNQAIEKFKVDLDSALKAEKQLKIFVFFTNVNLTVGDKDILLKTAKSKGIEYCDVYDRERIRIVLDSPDGLSIRFQYLQISLSEPEQAAFFAKWGTELQGVISESFKKVDEHLSRIQFNLESSRPLRYIAFSLRLSVAKRKIQLPHFRAMLKIFAKSAKCPYREINLETANNSSRATKQFEENINEGVAGAFWQNKKEILVLSRSVRREPQEFIHASGGYSEFDFMEKTPSLIDLDNNNFAFFVNKSLAELIEEIQIYANEYLIFSANKSDLSIDEAPKNLQTVWQFSKKELSDEWRRIMLNSGTGQFDFSSDTPLRTFTAKLTGSK